MAVYVPTDWHDLPNVTTPITAAQLNRIEAGVSAAYPTSYHAAGSPLLNINTTTTLTDVIVQSIGAGVMGTTGRLRTTIRGDWANSTGSTHGGRLQIVFGGTTIWDGTDTALGSSGAAGVRTPWDIQFEIVNLGTAASQFMSGVYRFGDPGSIGPPAAPIIGVAGGNLHQTTFGNNAMTLNTASAQALNVKFAPDTNSAVLSFRVFSWVVEVLYPN